MDNKEKEARKQKRLEVLGSNHPVCVECGEDDWPCLELHHIAGKAYGDDLCIVCKNCHSKSSDDQKDHPKIIGKNPTTHESIGHLLLGSADLFEDMAKKYREHGQFLIQAAKEDTKSK